MTAQGAGGPGALGPDAERILDDYLDELGARLGLPRDGSRQVLSEATNHLFADTEARIAAGAEPQEAARASIAVFGAPSEVADSLRRPGRRLVSTVWLLAGLGMVAVGLSGVFAAVLGAIRGWEFVAGDPAGLTYTAERCAQYMRIAPTAVSCRAAALVDHYSEVVDQRIVLGVIGLVVLGAYAWWRRGRGGVPVSRLLLGGVGVACFGLAALWQLASASTAAALDQGMVGAWLAGGLVCALLAVALTPTLVSGVRRSAER